MTRIPPAALLLSIAGLTPFLLGALLSAGAIDQSGGGLPLIGTTDGALLMTRYGMVILCFISGVLWGFATRAEGALATACYALSVVPALWTFLNPGMRADDALINLIIGFVGVLLLDYAFSRWQLAPEWWMSLRIPVTVVVVACLGTGVWA